MQALQSTDPILKTELVKTSYAQGRETRTVFSVAIEVFRCAEAIEFLSGRLASRRPTRLAFANANLLNMAYGDAELSRLLKDFVVLNDGAGVNLASRVLYGSPFPENLNGTDFCPAFLEACPEALRIYLLGGSPAIISRAADVVARRWPRHTIVGAHHGYFSPAEFDSIKQSIADACPDMVLVAMGNGLQEKIVEELVPSCAPCACGVGAWFDFIAGKVSRAPRLLRVGRMEWIYRLFLEPRRLWRRYLVGNPVFMWRVIRQRFGTSGVDS